MAGSNRITGFLVSFLVVFTTHPGATAQGAATLSTTSQSPARLRPDIEVDLLPYFLNGYSVHVGIERSHLRFEAEALRTNVPEWMHGNPGFDLSYQGGGFKTQYFRSRQQKGIFVGARAEIVRMDVRLKETTFERQTERQDIGVDGGFRFYLDRHVYLTPWAGVDYTTNARDVQLDNKTFKDRPVGYFAAVHIGYRF